MKPHALKRFLLAGGVSCLAFASPAYATLKEALDALKEQDFTFAFEELTRLATEEDNDEARYHLGRMYEEGSGLEKNEQTAFKFYQEAAEKGNDKAALKIGNAYYTGEKLEKDYRKAFKWYTTSADKGNFSAQYNIGVMYEEGTGVAKDPVQAFKAYKKSGNQGYAPAQVALGRMFLKGIGTPQDYSQAVFWYKLAADQGDYDAQMNLAKLYANKTVRGLPFNVIGAHVYFNLLSAYGTSPLKEEASDLRDELTKTMRNEDVVAAQKKANRWKKKKREESLPSQVKEELFDDDGPRTVSKEAESEKKEEKEIPITVNTDLKELLVAAGISRRDLNKAVRGDDFTAIESDLKQKAEDGDALARLALGDLYVLGQGIKPNPKEAVKIYQGLAEENNAIAFFRLAPMYCEGNGMDPDLAECYKMMLLAKQYADKDSAPSVEEALQMLDENLDKEIRDAGKKLFDERETAKNNPAKGGKKKWSNLFSGGGDKDSGKKERKEKKKAPKEEDAVDDLFSGL